MKLAPWVGFGIFLFAFGLRLIGINWGLPNNLHYQSYHPDEPINFAASQQIDPAHLKFTPGFYNYGTLYLTLAKVASGYCPPPEANTDAAVAAYERCCLYAGRILSALAGAGTAWLVFALLRRRTLGFGAAFGATAIAVAPAFVVHSRFFTVDVTATFLLTLSLYFALRLLPDKLGVEPSHFIRWAALGGLFAGFSAGTKYTGMLVILAVYAAILLSKAPGKGVLAALATVAAAFGFLITTPGVILDYGAFKSQFTYELAHTATGHGLVFVDTAPGYVYHLIGISVGFGTLAMLAGLAALAYAAYRKHRWAWIVLTFALPYYLLIGHSEVKFLRYEFPLYVPLAIAIGWAVGQSHRRGGWGRAAVILGIFAVGGQLRDSIQYNIWMASPDPRDEAGQFFKDEAAKHPGLTVGVTEPPWFYTPALYQDSAMSRPQWAYRLPGGIPLGLQKMAEAADPKVVYFDPTQRPDYVTYSSLKSYDLDRLSNDKGLPPDDQVLVDQWKTKQVRLEAEYVRFKRFGGEEMPRFYEEDLEYVHPYVYVWKRKDLP
jgi:hypothetical protein